MERFIKGFTVLLTLLLLVAFAGPSFAQVTGNWKNGILIFKESTTQETVLPVAPVFFNEEFLGKTVDNTSRWTFIDNNSATQGLLDNQSGGVLKIALTPDNETQQAGIYMGNQRPFTLNKGLTFETRLRFTSLPGDNGTDNKTIFVAGLISGFNLNPDNIAESIWFRADNRSGASTSSLRVENDDTVNETSKVATGVTMVANTWMILKIDCTDYTSCLFFVDGEQVAGSTTFNMSTTPALQMQPLIYLYKPSPAAGEIDYSSGVVEVDYIRVWQTR